MMPSHYSLQMQQQNLDDSAVHLWKVRFDEQRLPWYSIPKFCSGTQISSSILAPFPSNE